jgi:hypothetical protein
MNESDAISQKPTTGEGSTYSIRQAYRRAINHFMAGKQRTSCLQNPIEIEAYLHYEKQLSLHLQELSDDLNPKP